MSYQRLFLLSTMLIVLFCGCVENQLTTVYINEEYGIGIDPPTNWIEMNFSSDIWIAGWVQSPNSSASLTISPPYRLDEGLALSVFADDIEENYPNQYLNFSTITRDWLTVKGLTSYEIVYTYILNNSTIKERQVMVKHTRDVYVLKYHSISSEYDTYFSSVDQSILSFQVK